MQHDCSENLNFDLLTPRVESVGENTCYHVAAFCDSLLFDMLHDIVLKKITFWTLGQGWWQSICYHVAAFVIPFHFI